MRHTLLVLLAVSLLAALALPAAARAGSDARVSAFFYPWYGTSSRDGAFQHWAQAGHAPPYDIASAYYPARGLYSSSDQLVLGQQMTEIRNAGIDEIAVSWWGRGSAEDQRLPAVLAAARADGISVAAHLEPYGNRSVASTVADVAYLRGLGIKVDYVYRAPDFPAAEWAAAKAALHAGGTTLYAQTAMAGWASAAGFDGLYTYDIVIYSGDKFSRFCAEAHAQHLLCAPSVGPGYDAKRGSGDLHMKKRRNGATYDAMWRSAIAGGADRVTITSYNEWHEGTQIEPAATSPSRRHGYRYLSYDGAWKLHGQAAEYAYLVRTRYWADVFRSTSPAQPKTRAS
jgi:glycoprotein endo-alpha-1,2-mannosidase